MCIPLSSLFCHCPYTHCCPVYSPRISFIIHVTCHVASKGWGMTAVEPYRRFVSIELPFCLPVTVETNTDGTHSSCATATADRRTVEAFVPPSFLRPCIDDITPTAREKAERQEGGNDTAGKGEPKEMLGIATTTEYCTGEIFSGWRSLDFDADLESRLEGTADGNRSKLTTTANEEGEAERERIRRESFPSITPQLLLQGFFRNDLLVEVKRTRRVKRLRNVETGRVVKETYVDGGTDHKQTGVTVLGVVSREVDIVKPADFCFSPFTSENIESFPELCSGNIFPPGHFIGEKSPFEVALVYDSHSGKRDMDRLDNTATSFNCDEAPLWEFEGVPTLTMAAGDPNIPPPPSQAQMDILRRLNEGFDEQGCIEVRAVKALLEERPVWVTKDLIDAIFETGVCPRTHINKKAVACLTYIIKNGPFNRMRIRMGFNPYANPSSACLQRIAVKICRRSELGTCLRDISRVPYINEVLQEILDSKSHKRGSEEDSGVFKRPSSLPYRPRGTLFERLARAIGLGQLYVALQLIDVSDDAFLQELLSTVSADAEIPLEDRTWRCGWIGSGCYQRAINHIISTFTTFIREEVEPVLQRRRSGQENDQVGESAGERSPYASSTSSVSPESYGDDDNEDSLESVSPVDDLSQHPDDG
ncbi:RNA polymerase III transcription factor (TF)IIIC subunit [Trypanosoma brucei equiperdum]|uniref:RNA polymerase III transcription factor (TF)IIIC subunit n=1 Tax=Trypanosoma brucei equiperdum TaxID=630700 RepID=A0A3L6KW37_9TRYP|nr:RNA polymerase III transcription factor (TF)IIIC subunit [Trypanosoma brucei equiperdum]